MNELRSIASSFSYIFRVTTYNDLSSVAGRLDQGKVTNSDPPLIHFSIWEVCIKGTLNRPYTWCNFPLKYIVGLCHL